MKKFFFIIFSLLLVFLLSGCTLPFAKKELAGLNIDSLPEASVFLNGEYQGLTPFKKEELQPGDYLLKLVPRQGDYSSWEKQIKLTGGTETAVSYHFAENEEEVSSQILNLEPMADKKKASLGVSSIPDGAIIKIDGETKGFTPLSLEDVHEGEHTLVLSAPSFEEKQIQVRLVAGHKLLLNVQLAKEEIAEEASPSAEIAGEATESAELARPYVEIKETPTGWLRVRSEPTTAKDNEVTKVDPGEKFKLLDESENGWYQIEYAPGKKGWISGQYAEKFE